MRPHRRLPTRLPYPWDSPGKNTGVGCHFLLQCVKVKSLSKCPTLRDPMDCSLPGSSIHGIFQARVLEWGAVSFSVSTIIDHAKYFHHPKISLCSGYSSFFPLSSLATTDLYTVSIVLPFQMSDSWNHVVCSLFRLVSFT